MTAMPARNAASRGVTWERIREFACARTSFGTPALFVRKKFMARLRDDDPDVLVLKPIDDIHQQFLMETQPDVFLTTDHYRGYPSVLVRLSKVHPAELGILVEYCWGALAPPKFVASHDTLQ